MPLDILDIIAGDSLYIYRLMLAVPRFARSTIYHLRPDYHKSNNDYPKQLYWQNHFTNCMKLKKYVHYILNTCYHRVQRGPNAGPAIIREREMLWMQHGNLHREDGPAQIYWNKGIITTELWYLHNQRHRIDGPAYIDYDDGERRWYLHGKFHRNQEGPDAGPAIIKSCGCETWYLEGKMHRVQGPAVIYCLKHSTNGKEEWWLENERHRLDGPAITSHNARTQITREQWFKAGKLHCEHGPAIILRYSNNLILEEHWYVDNELYRDNNPAIIKRNHEGKIIHEEWYSHGVLHRNALADGSIPPAIIKQHLNSTIREWWYHGLRHRENEPAITITNHENILIMFAYYYYNKRHRRDGPAIMYNKLHRGFHNKSVYEQHRSGYDYNENIYFINGKFIRRENIE
jgi:hypothetical protein